MSKFIYPAVFHCEESGGYSVCFPDLLGCVTEGDTLLQAVEMAQDALGIYLYTLQTDGKVFPAASNPSDINLGGKDFLSMVEWNEVLYIDKIGNRADKIAFSQKLDNTTVKKTLTIPSWLNQLALNNNVNFSQVLQAALKEKLKV